MYSVLLQGQAQGTHMLPFAILQMLYGVLSGFTPTLKMRKLRHQALRTLATV